MAFGPDWERNETERKVAKVLEQVASQVGASNIQAGTCSSAAINSVSGAHQCP